MVGRGKVEKKITAVPSIGGFLSNRTAVLLFFSFFLSRVTHWQDFFLINIWPVGVPLKEKVRGPTVVR